MTQATLAMCRAACGRGSFTETTDQIRWGARTTTRLSTACADAVADGRSVSEVARSHRVSWPTVRAAVDERAVDELGKPEPVTTLGIDEAHLVAPRWAFDSEAGCWARTDPWQNRAARTPPGTRTRRTSNRLDFGGYRWLRDSAAR